MNDIDINSLLYLKKIAIKCALLQLYASVLYFTCAVFFPKSATVAITCGIIAIIICLAPIAFAILYSRFSLVFSSLCAFNIAPIWFILMEAVRPGYNAYSYSQPLFRMEAFFWISTFQLFVNLLYGYFWKTATPFSIKTFSFLKSIKLKPIFYIQVTILSFVVPLLAFYFFYGSAKELWIAISAGRSGGGSMGGLLKQEGSAGGAGSLMLPFNFWWQLTSLFGLIAFQSSKKKFKFLPILSLTFGVLVILVFFLSGSRGSMLFVAAPYFFNLLYYNWNRGFKFWVICTFLLLLSISLMELQVRFRGNLLDVLLSPSKAAKAQNYASATSLNPNEMQRDDNMYLFCLMLKSYPEKYHYEGFQDYFAVLVNPIPRVFWPGKPIRTGAKDDLSAQPNFILEGPLYMGTTSLTFTVVGESYLAGGLFGIIVYSLTYALFLIFFDSVIYYTLKKEPFPVGMLGLCIFLGFWGYRSFNALITFIYPLILLIVMFKILGLFKNQQKKVSFH